MNGKHTVCWYGKRELKLAFASLHTLFRHAFILLWRDHNLFQRTEKHVDFFLQTLETLLQGDGGKQVFPCGNLGVISQNSFARLNDVRRGWEPEVEMSSDSESQNFRKTWA